MARRVGSLRAAKVVSRLAEYLTIRLCIHAQVGMSRGRVIFFYCGEVNISGIRYERGIKTARDGSGVPCKCSVWMALAHCLHTAGPDTGASDDRFSASFSG